MERNRKYRNKMQDIIQTEKTKKKHIAFYIGSLNKGGAERVFVNLAEYFLSEGYQVTMVTQYQRQDEYLLPEGVTRVLSDITEEETTKSRILNFGRRFAKLHTIWKTYKPDVVLSCVGKNNFMTIATTAFTHTKPVVSVVGEAKEEYPGRIMRFLANLLFPHASGVILQTERSRYFFNKKIQQKAVVLPNSLNPDFIKPRYEGDRDKTIVSVGRMDANKNQEMMIRAFARITNQYPEYTLTIYGDGELRGYLEKLIEDLHLEDKVFLPGIVTDVAKRLEKAYAFLLTSYSEGVSNALIEAMASGLAVISTDVPSGGTTELIEDGVNGLVIPTGDEDALVKAMQNVLDNKEMAQRLGKEASRIQEKLMPDRVNSLWKQYFEEIMEKQRGKKDEKKRGICNFLQCVLFCAIFVLLLTSVSYIVRTNGDVKDRFSGFYGEENNTLDVVMIGSSPVFPYYAAPKIWGDTGITMYPLSSNVQRPEAMKYLVEETEKTQSPGLYIFEMRMYTFEKEGLTDNMAYTRGVTDNMRYSKHRIETINALVPEEDEDGRLSYYLDIMKYHTNWKMLLMPSELKNFAFAKKSPLKGFDMKTDVCPYPAPQLQENIAAAQLPAGQEETLRDLLGFLTKEKKQALFIVSPYGVSDREQQMFLTLAEIVESYGYPFLNLNDYYEEIGINFGEDYADYGSHTNAIGAEKCTEFLESYLAENYTFTDKRRENGYESWNDAYALYIEEMDVARQTILDHIAKGEFVTGDGVE